MNEPPTTLTLSQVTIVENLRSGSVAATLSTSDPDSLDAHVFSLEDTSSYPDNTAFTISENELLVVLPADFETKSTYTLKLKVVDGGGLFFETEVEIEILDDRQEDADKDGLTQEEEEAIGTKDTVADSDGDGFLDGKEVAKGTDPLDPNDHPDPNKAPTDVTISTTLIPENQLPHLPLAQLTAIDPDAGDVHVSP